MVAVVGKDLDQAIARTWVTAMRSDNGSEAPPYVVLPSMAVLTLSAQGTRSQRGNSGRGPGGSGCAARARVFGSRHGKRSGRGTWRDSI